MTRSISADLRQAFDVHAAAGRTAFDGPQGTVGYAELARQIDGFAAGARDWGLERGELVGLVARKTPQGVAAYFGLMQAGVCPCFIEPQLAPGVVISQMRSIAMRRLVLDEAMAPEFDGVARQDIDVRLLSTLQSDGAFIDRDLDVADRAMVLFTSGSTGRPKGVLLSHGGLLANAAGVIRHTGITPQDRLLHVMPLHHTNGINNQLIVPFLAGATVILVERFSAEGTIALLRQQAPTYMTGVPTMFARMLPHLSAGERFASLRFLRCGSAPITPALHEQIEAAFGVPLVVSYGLSEATCTSTMNPPAARRIGSIGTVLAGQDLRLFEPGRATEAAPGEEGEIRIAGATLMQGYLGEDVEQPIVDGWLHTGDLGRFDEAGYLSITGRIKDIIIRGGENISPGMVEKQLASHPAVRDCSVVGAPHADLGEVPVAFVILREDSAATEQELKDFVKARLARIYVPDRIFLVDNLPTNGVGKIDRKALRGRIGDFLAA